MEQKTKDDLQAGVLQQLLNKTADEHVQLARTTQEMDDIIVPVLLPIAQLLQTTRA